MPATISFDGQALPARLSLRFPVVLCPVLAVELYVQLIQRRVLVMDRLDVLLGQVEIELGGSDICMSQHKLQGPQISTADQIYDGEGVTEQVEVQSRDTHLLGQMPHQVGQSVVRQRLAVDIQDQVTITAISATAQARRAGEADLAWPGGRPVRADL